MCTMVGEVPLIRLRIGATEIEPDLDPTFEKGPTPGLTLWDSAT
jgi:hypothetical protein